jgi:hypothetical protein
MLQSSQAAAPRLGLLVRAEACIEGRGADRHPDGV